MAQATIQTRKFTGTFLGYNKDNLKSPIGVISYNTITGQMKQCEVFSTFWGDSSTIPDFVQICKHLIAEGHGLIRFSTVKYSSLV